MNKKNRKENRSHEMSASLTFSIHEHLLVPDESLLRSFCWHQLRLILDRILFLNEAVKRHIKKLHVDLNEVSG